MNKWLRSLCWVIVSGLLTVAGGSLAVAGIEVVEFSQPELRERYQGLIEELRCPKCQNQNLADSDAPISIDLRQQVRTLLEEGLDDGAIKRELVSRYSDFILYRPAVNRATAVLWGLPPALLLAGVALLVLLRRRRPQPATSSVLSTEQRVAELLADQQQEHRR